MAIDTREKRQTAASLLVWSLTPTVDPAVAGFPVSSRQAAAHIYSGIAVAAVAQAGLRGLFAFWMGGGGGTAGVGAIGRILRNNPMMVTLGKMMNR